MSIPRMLMVPWGQTPCPWLLCSLWQDSPWGRKLPLFALSCQGVSLLVPARSCHRGREGSAAAAAPRGRGQLPGSLCLSFPACERAPCPEGGPLRSPAPPGAAPGAGLGWSHSQAAALQSGGESWTPPLPPSFEHPNPSLSPPGHPIPTAPNPGHLHPMGCWGRSAMGRLA